jgi:iron complex outermembrane recepter protein
VRVGLAAQAYDFPAPTGIANYSLRDAAPDNRLSVVADRGPFDASSVEFDGHYGSAGAPVSVNL